MELNKETILRAWKDEEYRSGLPEEVRMQIPDAPGKGDELTDEQLEAAAGGFTPALVPIGIAAAVSGGSIAAGYGAAELADGGDC